ADVEAGVVDGVAADARQQPLGGEGGRGAETERRRAPGAAQLLHGRGEAAEALLQQGQRRRAGGGQRQRPVAAVEQGDAEMLLEVLDLVADRGRADMQLARRLAETGMAGGGPRGLLREWGGGHLRR